MAVVRHPLPAMAPHLLAGGRREVPVALFRHRSGERGMEASRVDVRSGSRDRAIPVRLARSPLPGRAEPRRRDAGHGRADRGAGPDRPRGGRLAVPGLERGREAGGPCGRTLRPFSRTVEDLPCSSDSLRCQIPPVGKRPGRILEPRRSRLWNRGWVDGWVRAWRSARRMGNVRRCNRLARTRRVARAGRAICQSGITPSRRPSATPACVRSPRYWRLDQSTADTS